MPEKGRGRDHSHAALLGDGCEQSKTLGRIRIQADRSTIEPEMVFFDHQNAPTLRRRETCGQTLRHDQAAEIGAAITNHTIEFRPPVHPATQSLRFAVNSPDCLVAKPLQIQRIVFRKQTVAMPKAGHMPGQQSLKFELAIAESRQLFPGLPLRTGVLEQVSPCLFALEKYCLARMGASWNRFSTGGDVGSGIRSRDPDFPPAESKSRLDRPTRGQALQFFVFECFAACHA